MSAPMRTAIITVSTSVAAGASEDRGGPLLARLALEAGAVIVAQHVVADDLDALTAQLRALTDPVENLSFIFTTGGTGLTADDITPEATAAVIDRPAPGFAEAMRAESLRHTPLGILTRSVSGIAGRTLIINFPGNPPALEQLFPVIAPTLRHAAETLARDGGRDAGR